MKFIVGDKVVRVGHSLPYADMYKGSTYTVSEVIQGYYPWGGLRLHETGRVVWNTNKFELAQAFKRERGLTGVAKFLKDRGL